jgi:phage baseplate assembly protein W
MSALDDVVTRLVERVESRYYGKYRGLVTDNDDPSTLGRVKAKVPRLLDEVELGWALPAFAYGGAAEMGFFAVPEVGAGVWIEFEEGDLSYPIWSGTWYQNGQIPESATPKQKVLKTTSGHKIVLDDDANSITITDSNGNVISTDGSDIKITAGNATKITIDGTARVRQQAQPVSEHAGLDVQRAHASGRGRRTVSRLADGADPAGAAARSLDPLAESDHGMTPDKRLDLAYPYAASGLGVPQTAAPDRHLRDMILNVLFTVPGERVNVPEFGAGIGRLVFAPNGSALRASAQFLIATNLQRWLGDLVNVQQVDVSSFEGEEQTVTIDITYVDKRSGARSTLQVQV